MAEMQYVRFLDKLIHKTKYDEIEWEYLDSNEYLCKKMKWYASASRELIPKVIFDTEVTYYNPEDSFCAEIDETTIVIFAQQEELVSFYVIPPTFRKILRLSADEYGDYITRLLNVVQSKFPSSDQFVIDFLTNY